MHNITLPLLQNFTRPTISLYGVNALIDPGSTPLILNFSDEAIYHLFGGVDTTKIVPLKGVGSATARVFQLNHFCIGDMVFRDFPALVCPMEDTECPIVIGCSMYSRDSVCTYDFGHNTVTFALSEVFFRAGKPCIRHRGGWGFLDFEDDNFVALPITTNKYG